MKLSELIHKSDIEIIQGNKDIDIKGISINSKQVEPGDIFIAYKGLSTDSHQFIPEAIDKGASVIYVENEVDNIPDNITLIKGENTRKNLSILADNFYDHPSKNLKMIGVTGTKGKTTTVEMIAQILKEAGLNVGTIGTLGIRYNGKTIKLPNTTPDSLELNKNLRDMVDQGVEIVVMENSSQGLKLDRTSEIQYDFGILLNIDRDHIGKNEHKDFDDYVNSKLKLTTQSDNIIINCSDPIWNYLKPEDQKKAITFSNKEDRNADYYFTDFKPLKKPGILGSKFQLNNNPERGTELEILGKYNSSNALAAIAVGEHLNIDFNDIKNGLKKVQVNGRSALYPLAAENNITVIADFAHNRLSANNLLNDLRDYNPGKIICIFGVEFDETKLRRYDLGKEIGKLADLAILTTCYLGNEDFESVNNEVIDGLNDSKGDYKVIPDRKEAYEKALSLMNEDDILILMNLFVDHSGDELLDEKSLRDNIIKYSKIN